MPTDSHLGEWSGEEQDIFLIRIQRHSCESHYLMIIPSIFTDWSSLFIESCVTLMVTTSVGALLSPQHLSPAVFPARIHTAFRTESLLWSGVEEGW
jgi:hypothetical protein